MNVDLWINDEKITKEIDGDAMLLDFLRDHGCLSVKRGCETSNCGLCTVIMDDKPVLSCSTLVARAAGKHIYTLEGLQAEAQAFGECLADQGAEQCGFCNPGLVLTVLAMAGLGLGVNLRSVAAAGPRVILVVTLSLLMLGGTAFAVLDLLHIG